MTNDFEEQPEEGAAYLKPGDVGKDLLSELKKIVVKTGTSKYLGVHWCESQNRWRAKIGHNKVHIYLGSFVNEIDAAIAYNNGAKKYHGDFASLNII